MKNIQFLVLLWMTFGVISILSAQTFCFTPATSKNSELFAAGLHFANIQDSYTLRVYVHVIRHSDGSAGQSPADVDEMMDILDGDFNPHGIFLSWDGVIDYIDDDFQYNNPNVGIYNINNHSDGIDMYLYGDDSPAGGRAQGVGENSAFWVGGTYWDYPYGSVVKSHITSHELGHVLFLWHTHHGTINEGGNDNHCPELVNGSNGHICGDYVTDTPADPYIGFNVTPPDCTFYSSQTDSNGDYYDPDEQLIMSYSSPECMSYFSSGQGFRMRAAISALDHLEKARASTCSFSELTILNDVSNGEVDNQTSLISIIATNVIENGAWAKYGSPQNVILKPGFEVKQGATLEIYTAGACEASAFSNSASENKNDEANSKEVLKNEEFLVYPNPTSGEVAISYHFVKNKNYEVFIYNAAGQLVKTKIVTSENSVIKLLDLEKGLYFLNLNLNDGTVGQARILIEN